MRVDDLGAAAVSLRAQRRVLGERPTTPPAMTRRIYTLLERAPERFDRLASARGVERELERFLDDLGEAEEELDSGEARELEAMLLQHQSHVLGRADRF